MDEMKKMKTGTTTLGLVCDDGVILAADRRATMGYMISSKATIKVEKLDPGIGMYIYIILCVITFISFIYCNVNILTRGCKYTFKL